MAQERPSGGAEDSLAFEVDRLLKKLPGADSSLRGEGDRDRAARAAGTSAAGRAEAPEPSPLARQASAWLRALAAAGVGAAVAQWPYAHDCGRPLYLYLGVIGTVMIAGGWASVWSWRSRVAAAHVLSLIVVFWGIVLAAEQILPRVQYAADRAEWRCSQ
jgi:hypothetical protein